MLLVLLVYDYTLFTYACLLLFFILVLGLCLVMSIRAADDFDLLPVSLVFHLFLLQSVLWLSLTQDMLQRAVEMG